jgi:hypothetical protein
MTPSRLARISALICLCLSGCAARIDPKWEQFQAEEAARWQQARAEARSIGVATPPDIPDQPVIRNLARWDRDIAVTTEDYRPDLRRSDYRLWTVDHAAGSIRPFTEVPCVSYHDVAHSAGVGRLLVCEDAGATNLLRHVDGRWDVVAGAPAGTQVRVVSDDRYVVLASEQTLVLLSATSFAVVATAPTPKVGHGVAPSAMLLTADRLFVGFSAGEFGGGLYRYDLAVAEPTLVGVALLDENVSALMRSSGGSAWAATGLSHMGGVHGGVYRLDGRAILSSGPVGLVASPDGDLFVGARALGVMKLPRTGRQLVQHLFVDGAPVLGR